MFYLIFFIIFFMGLIITYNGYIFQKNWFADFGKVTCACSIMIFIIFGSLFATEFQRNDVVIIKAHKDTNFINSYTILYLDEENIEVFITTSPEEIMAIDSNKVTFNLLTAKTPFGFSKKNKLEIFKK